MDDRQPNDPALDDGQRALEQVPTDRSAATDTRTPADAPRPARRGLMRFAPTALAFVIAFVWGGLAYREMGPKPSITLPGSVAGAAGPTAVKGSEAPPAWIAGFASAFCNADAKTIAADIGPPLNAQADQISQALAQRSWSCDDMRYIGGGTNPKGTFYVYLMRDNKDNAQEWWVFTTQNDKVISID